MADLVPFLQDANRWEDIIEMIGSGSVIRRSWCEPASAIADSDIYRGGEIRV